MSRGGGGSGPGPVLMGGSSSVSRPLGLLDAISKIQMFAAVEKLGKQIPLEYLLFKDRVGFWEVGARGVILDFFIMAIFTPLSMATFQEVLPIFGSNDFSSFDRGFAFLLAGSFALAYNMLIAVNLSACYFGRVPTMAIRYLYSGLLSANVVKCILLFVWFHMLRDWIAPERVAGFFTRNWTVLGNVMTPEGATWIQYWLQQFRGVLWPSAYFVVGSTAFCLLIPAIAFWLGKRDALKEYERNLRYDVIT
ncbi:MAG: hypothetical protein NPIRA02_01240 [Nitrospirales bacterium]|nr:MAG: hypothetical protein NPIRA02_01240 [Nitrospirales bacterium]